ncbi:MAG: LLM class flavin-dependent oxidoreductase, partial [Candidatus Binatia bacterium]
MAVEVGVYLAQVGFTWEDLRARVVECDRLGIDSVWLMDHLYPPALPKVPSFEAWTSATALAASTGRVRLGHLVLANGLRHPALLAKMAITLDHVSGGRFDFGLGSGSYAPEFEQFGIDFPGAAERSARLGEALEVIRLLFTEESPSYDGRYYR